MYPPHAKLARLVDATVEPLSLAEARNYLRIPSTVTEDDALIGDLVTAARMTCEQMVDRSFITTTWRLTLDYLPFAANPFYGFQDRAVAAGWGGGGSYDRIDPRDGTITLPMPPLIGLVALSYRDLAGTVEELDVSEGTLALVVSPGTPGRISPGYGRYFPFTRPTIAAVNIDYTAGYGPDASDVPKSVKQAIRLLVSHYYEHRTADAEVPCAVRNLLDTCRWGGYA